MMLRACWGENENLHVAVNEVLELKIYPGCHLPIGKNLSNVLS